MLATLLGGMLSRLLFVFLRVQTPYGGSFPPPLSKEREAECFRLMHDASAADAVRASARPRGRS